jgi:pimeloyl-ACP methyl ester carboxylesterase
MFNHGSTGIGTDPTLFTETFFDVGLADFLNNRGWIVAFSQRRGRGKSGGRERALDDIGAAMAALRRGAKFAPWRVLIGGESRGGILSVAYAGMHPDQIFGVINFVGGWVGTGCDTASHLNGTLFERGARFDRPTLWRYGDQDPFYDIQHSRNNFNSFRSAGGQGTFLTFNVPGGYGHTVLNAPGLWQGPVADYLMSFTDGIKGK